MLKRLGIAALALSMAGTTAVFAQSGTGGQGPGGWGQGQHERRGMPSPDQQLERMSQQLNLTAEQKDKIKPILEEHAKQMQSLRNDSSMSREDRRAKFQEMRQNMANEIRPILNSDQQKKWEEMMNRQPQRGGRSQGEPQPQ